MEDFDSLNEKQLESLERGLSDLKHNRVMSSDKFWKELLSKKEQQELVNEAYIKYQNQTMFHTDDLMSLKESDGMNMSTGEKTKVYRQFAPVEFINKCKTDKEFSEKWGLTIKERELSLEERFNIRYPGGKFSVFQENYPNTHFYNDPHSLLDAFNIPTRLITITYHDKTIKSYE